MSVWRFLLKYVLKIKYLLLILLAAFFVVIFLQRYQQYIVAQMIGMLSDTLDQKNSQILVSLGKYLGIYGVVLLLISAFGALQNFMEARVLPFLNTSLSKDLFVMVHKHPVRFFEEEMAGHISGKVSHILSNVEYLYFDLLFGAIVPVMEILMNLFFIAFVNVRLALIFGLINLSFLLLTICFRKSIVPFSEQKSKLKSISNGVFIDGIANSYLVKSFANYFYEKHRYFLTVRQTAEAQKKELKRRAVVNWLSKSIFDLMLVLSYGFVFWYWYRFNISVADVVMVTLLVSTMIGSIRSMGHLASDFASVYGAIQDGLDLLLKPCDVVDLPNAQPIKPEDNGIRFENVTFAYGERNVFSAFNLEIKPNQKIGLVGHSGSGKSTLVKLLMRYYDLNGGQILAGGENIADVTQESLRKMIAVIPQESTLFNRSIMDNIRYGNTKATDEQVIEAAKKAFAHDFVMKLPDQYESKVGERGVMLSGGERQRIAIARAILKNAPILILDEATSALDSESEQYIQQSLKELMKNKTVIAIAHRLSTLNEMDQLIVLDNGQIVERGSHTDLLKKHGAYYHFFHMQTKGQKAES